MLDQELELVCKDPHRFYSQALQRGLDVPVLDDTLSRLAGRSCSRVARVTHNTLIAALGKYNLRPGDSWK